MRRSPRSRSSAPGIQNAPGYAARMFGALADAGVNIEMISTSEIRITLHHRRGRAGDRGRALHAAFELERPDGGRGRAAPRPAEARPVASRDRRSSPGARALRRRRVDERRRPRVARERRARGLPGRRRRADCRPWPRAAGPGSAPPGRGAPAVARVSPDLARARTASGGWPRRVALAMADAAEDGRRPRRRHRSRLKWPNDLVVDRPADRDVRKLAGVLGETRRARARDDPRVVVGIGDQRATGRAPTFPAELAGDDDLAARAGRRPADRHGTRCSTASSAARAGDRSALRRRRVRRGRPGGAPADDRAGRRARGARTARDRRYGPSASTDRPARCSVEDRGAPDGRRAVVRRRDPSRPARATDAGRGVTPWPARCLEERRPDGGRPLTRRPPRSRSLARRGRAARPRAGSTPSIAGTSPRCTTSRSTSSATITRPRTPRNARSCPPSPRCPVPRAGHAGRRRGRLHVPRLAVPDRPERRRRTSAARLGDDRKRRSRPPWTPPHPVTSSGPSSSASPWLRHGAPSAACR